MNRSLYNPNNLAKAKYWETIEKDKLETQMLINHRMTVGPKLLEIAMSASAGSAGIGAGKNT